MGKVWYFNVNIRLEMDYDFKDAYFLVNKMGT